MFRRIGRILAFQALYSWAVGGVNIDDLLSFSWIERDLGDNGTSSDDEEGNATANENYPEELIADNGIKYCLSETQLKTFESLPAEKKEGILQFSRLLVQGTVENIDEIDTMIKGHLATNWSIDRINKVVLAVIRMSVYELLYQKGTHANIVIDEAVGIVKDYGADDSHKFTNAILEKISQAINSQEKEISSSSTEN